MKLSNRPVQSISEHCFFAAVAVLSFACAQQVANAACQVDCDILSCYESASSPGTFYSTSSSGCCWTYNTNTGKGGTPTGTWPNYIRQYYGSRVCEPVGTTIGKADCDTLPTPGSSWTRSDCKLYCNSGGT